MLKAINFCATQKQKKAKTMQKENFHKNPIKRGTFFCDINHIFRSSLVRTHSLPCNAKWEIYCFLKRAHVRCCGVSDERESRWRRKREWMRKHRGDGAQVSGMNQSAQITRDCKVRK